MKNTENPGLEIEHQDRFSRIPNLLLEALSIVELNRTQLHICHFILRRTYGWHRHYDAISLSDFAAACGTSRQNISRQIHALVIKHIIRCLRHDTGKTNVYALVADPAQWDPSCINLTALAANQIRGVFKCTPSKDMDWDSLQEYDPGKDPATESDNSPEDVFSEVEGSYEDMTPLSYEDMTFNREDLSGNDGLRSYQDMTPESYEDMTPLSYDDMTFNQPPAQQVSEFAPYLKKDLKKVKERKKYLPDSIEYELAELLFNRIKENYSGLKTPDLHDWSRSMERIIRLDKRDPEEVRKVILFAQGDPYWYKEIISAERLRYRYDLLNIKRIDQKESKRKYVSGSDRDSWREESEEFEQFFRRR